jgi:hypothetical protein
MSLHVLNSVDLAEAASGRSAPRRPAGAGGSACRVIERLPVAVQPRVFSKPSVRVDARLARHNSAIATTNGISLHL